MWRISGVLLAVIALTACSDNRPVATALDNIDRIFSNSHSYNDIHYNLTYDPDYPCSAVVHEKWNESGVDWYQRYRFEVQDISPGTFLEVQNGRRAIVYDGEKTDGQGNTLEFPPKKIILMEYRAGLYDDDQVAVLENMMNAITVCEERYGL